MLSNSIHLDTNRIDYFDFNFNEYKIYVFDAIKTSKFVHQNLVNQDFVFQKFVLQGFGVSGGFSLWVCLSGVGLLEIFKLWFVYWKCLHLEFVLQEFSMTSFLFKIRRFYITWIWFGEHSGENLTSRGNGFDSPVPSVFSAEQV